MKAPKTAVQDANPSSPRRAGRRPKTEAAGTGLSRDAVIQCTVELAQRESIFEVSMVRVAREMGVAPGLIHYYIGSKGDLLSSVLNFAYKERLAALPPLTGDWRTDLESVCRSTLKSLARWPGLANYIATQNRFRLFQRVKPGETDYGLAYFDHIGRVLRKGGFTAAHAALVYHLLMIFVTSVGAENANRQAPGDHEDFIVRYVLGFDRRDIPGASFLVVPFAKIDNKKSFEVGLKLLMDGFEMWLPSRPDAG
jgi:AcrR family transcriptional regulator